MNSNNIYKKVHQIGGYGSFGYRYDWKLEEAQKNILVCMQDEFIDSLFFCLNNFFYLLLYYFP